MTERRTGLVNNEAELGVLDLRKRIEEILLKEGRVSRTRWLDKIIHRGPIIGKANDMGIEKYGWKQRCLVTTEKGTNPP